MKIVKFCNIKNVYETRTAARLGADYLGFHLISESDFKRISEIKISIRELKKTYPKTKSVLVTKETNIKKLKSILDEMEFEVVQLHYPDSTNIIAQIRSLYGSRLKIIQVITTNNTVLSPLADIYLLDKSFLGGTGEEIGLEKIEKYLKIINKPNVLLAGGITIDNIDKYLNLRIIGFDIQTGIKSAYTNIKDNTDPTKIAKITKILHKAVIIPQNQVGYVIQDINQQNNDSLDNALHAKVDFLHIDISDGFINQPTDLVITKQIINSIQEYSLHTRLQLHIFAKDEEAYRKIIKSLQTFECTNIQVFLHINRDNFDKFDFAQLKKRNIYFGLDVKDLIDEQFNWEQFIRKESLICLQSTEHSDRINNFNRIHKIIKYIFKTNLSITLDRGVDLKSLTEVDDISNISLVSGSYLKQNIIQKYNLLKMYFYVKK